MNSSSLKKTHSSLYQQFFLENQVVLSAPFIMNRSGDVLHNYSGISIKQQIPLRIYVGYARKSSPDIKLNKIYYHDINEHKFIPGNLLEYAPYFNDLQKYISSKYGSLCQSYGGIEINILTELPRGVGLGFGSIIPLLLSLLLYRFQGKVSPDNINSWKHQNINNLLQDQFSPFYEFFLDALTLDKHMYGMVSPGTKLASFFSTYYPVVSFSEDFDKKNPHATIVDNKFFGFTFPDLFPQLREIPYSSIDYGIVYSGKPVMLEQISGGHYKNNTNSFKAVKSCVYDLFGDYLKELSPHKMPRFYKHLLLPEGDESELIYGKLMGILSLKVFYAMSNMYRDGYDELTMLQLLDVLKKLRQGDCVTRDSSSTYLSFMKHILEYFHGASKYLALFPNDSTIMGGSTIFAIPMEGFRKTILDTTHKTTQQFSGSTLLYTNRLDGLEHDGCIVEQDLGYDIHSSFLESNICIIRSVNGNIAIADCETVLERYKKGVLLDTLHNKIYLNGQRLTSQELHSQTATIEVMKELIAHLGEEISNKQLSPSSYSKNKNDMLSKIVLPLLDLVEKKTGKKLPLVCKGSLYDFYMKLSSSDIDIMVVQRMGKH